MVLSAETVLVRFDGPNDWHALVMYDPTVDEQGSREISADGRYELALGYRGVFATKTTSKDGTITINARRFHLPGEFQNEVDDGKIPCAIFVDGRWYDFHGQTFDPAPNTPLSEDIKGQSPRRRLYGMQVRIPAKPTGVSPTWNWKFRTVSTSGGVGGRSKWKVEFSRPPPPSLDTIRSR